MALLATGMVGKVLPYSTLTEKLTDREVMLRERKAAAISFAKNLFGANSAEVRRIESEGVNRPSWAA